MKKLLQLFLALLLASSSLFAQVKSSCEGITAFNPSRTPDMGIVITSGDAETVWNALRLGIYAREQGDSVVVYVTGKAMDVYINDTSKFKIQDMSLDFLSKGGYIYACATCAKLRNTENVTYCTITSITDLYFIIRRSKKILTF